MKRMILAGALGAASLLYLASPASAAEVSWTATSYCTADHMLQFRGSVTNQRDRDLHFQVMSGNGGLSPELVVPAGQTRQSEWPGRVNPARASAIGMTGDGWFLADDGVTHEDASVSPKTLTIAYEAGVCGGDVAPTPVTEPMPSCPPGHHHSALPPDVCPEDLPPTPMPVDTGTIPQPEVTPSTPTAPAPETVTPSAPSPSAPRSVASKPAVQKPKAQSLPATGASTFVLIGLGLAAVVVGAAFLYGVTYGLRRSPKVWTPELQERRENEPHSFGDGY